jgi:hypothetical protein
VRSGAREFLFRDGSVFDGPRLLAAGTCIRIRDGWITCSGQAGPPGAEPVARTGGTSLPWLPRPARALALSTSALALPSFPLVPRTRHPVLAGCRPGGRTVRAS